MSGLSGLSRPLRVAGLALIGLGVIAGVVGTAVALGGDDSANTAAPTSVSAEPSSPAPTASSAPAVTSSSEPAPSSSSAPASPSAEPPPSSSSQAPEAPGDGSQSAKWVTLRIYNNSTIKGLATRAGDEFRSEGWTVAEISNYSSGIIPTTTAYFRPGTDEEAAAKSLADAFGMRAEPRFEGIQNSNPGVIVIVTNDYKNAKSK